MLQLAIEKSSVRYYQRCFSSNDLDLFVQDPEHRDCILLDSDLDGYPGDCWFPRDDLLERDLELGSNHWGCHDPGVWHSGFLG